MRVQLMLLFTVAVLSGRGVIAQDETAESKAIQKTVLLGGKVERDDKLPGSPIVCVSFASRNRFNDKYLHLLKPFTNLTTLDLLDAPITDVGLKEIGKHTNLTSLHLSGPEITDEGVKRLEDLKSLTELTLCGTSVTLDGQKNLRTSLPKLTILDESATFKRIEQRGGKFIFNGLSDSVTTIAFDESKRQQQSKLTDADLMELKRLRGVKTLTYISFTGCTQITDAGVQDLVQFKNLKFLSISNCEQITVSALKPFKDHEKLRLLHFTYSQKLTDVDMKEIGQLKNLAILSLRHCSQITDSGIEELKQLHDLQHLDVTGTQISGAGLKALKELKSLTSLSLQNCRNIEDADMEELGEFTSLTSLRLTGTQITDVGCRELQESLPNLKISR